MNYTLRALAASAFSLSRSADDFAAFGWVKNEKIDWIISTEPPQLALQNDSNYTLVPFGTIIVGVSVWVLKSPITNDSDLSHCQLALIMEQRQESEARTTQIHARMSVKSANNVINEFTFSKLRHETMRVWETNFNFHVSLFSNLSCCHAVLNSFFFCWHPKN